MSIAARLNAALIWTANRFVVGALTCVLSLGVVTAPAALAAGAAASRNDSLSASVPLLLRTFRERLRPGLGLGVVVAAMTASAVVSALWLSSDPAPGERVVAYVVGLQAVSAALAALGYGAALLEMGAAATPRGIMILFAASPGTFVAMVMLAAVAFVSSVLVAPILCAPVVGIMTQVVAGVRVRYDRRRLQLASTQTDTSR